MLWVCCMQKDILYLSKLFKLKNTLFEKKLINILNRKKIKLICLAGT